MMKKNISLTKSLKVHYPELFKSLKRQLSIDDSLLDNLTIDGTFSLKNHKRSRFGKVENGGFISIKGFLGEIEVYTALIDDDQDILGNKNTAEMFPMLERKVPYQCLYSELKKEFELSVVLIEGYLKNFKKLPNVPIPIELYSYDDAFKEEVLSTLKGKLPRFVFNEVEDILKNDTFGVMKFFYPSAPFRVMDVRSKDHRAELYWNSNYSILFLWCDLLIDFVSLGYLPGSKHFSIQGTSVDPQNLLLSGGFSDLGSLVPISELSERVAFESFIYCIQKINQSGLLLMELNISNTSMKREREAYLHGKLHSYIQTQINHRFGKSGNVIPRLLARYVEEEKECILKNYFSLT